MEKVNGDTEIAFIFALLFWCLSGGVAWVAHVFYRSWQSNEIIEFSSRKMEIFNLLPMNAKFYLVMFALGVMAFFSVQQTKKFVTLCFANKPQN